MGATRKQNPTMMKPGWLVQYDAGAYGNSDVIAAQPQILLSLFVQNKAASGTIFLQLFDAAAVPAGGTVPVTIPLAVAGGANASISFNEISDSFSGLSFASGVTWAASTTAGTFTPDSTSSLWVTARFC